VEQTVEEILTNREKYEGGELDTVERDDRPLWNVLNRYVSKHRPIDGRTKTLTLFLAHANGFPKEVRMPWRGCYSPSLSLKFTEDLGAHHSTSVRLCEKLKAKCAYWRNMGMGSYPAR
jgi:hypothetical protein